MPDSSDTVVEKVRALGVKDPVNPSCEELKLILDAFIRRQELDLATYREYIKILDVSSNSIWEGFKLFSRG
jgi:hypothetical protein